MMTTVEDIKVTPFCKIADRRGNLTVAQSGTDLPFEIQRAYWVYDVPGGECRGGHAHKECQEMIIAINGSFTLTLDDGVNRRSFLLNHPYEGVLVPVGIWRTLDDFSRTDMTRRIIYARTMSICSRAVYPSVGKCG